MIASSSYNRTARLSGSPVLGPLLLLTLPVIAALALPAAAHETDQFTLPAGREFADIGDELTKTAYTAVEKGVNRINARIKSELDAKRSPKEFQTPDAIAASVNSQFPAALFLIDSYDKRSLSAAAKAKYPGRIVGYKPASSVRKHVQLPLNPLNAWECATVQAYGYTFGTDKIGHFTDMGMHYYRAYRKALKEGLPEDKALGKAIYLGTDEFIFAESGLLGWATAGAYSNADLVANFMGMHFYKNLAEPVMLKGAERPPMLVLENNYWKITSRVRPDSAFFSLFVSEHFDESLNPSWYLTKMQKGIQKAIEAHGSDVLERHADANGNRRGEKFFRDKIAELSTYYGTYYGHKGEAKDLLSIDRTCFGEIKANAPLDARDRVGRTRLHVAAERGDLETIRQLVDRGADVNIRVRSNEERSAEWGNTPLHLAAREGQVEAVKLLIERGADVNARNDRGATPLHKAIAHPTVALLLIERKAEVNAADARGRSALHWAANDRSGSALPMLLQHGANPNLRDIDGETPSHCAARAENIAALDDLANAKADVNIADKFGTTPLHLAARADDPLVASVLIRSGAGVNTPDVYGCTPLHDATHARGEAVVAMLLGAGATPTISNAYGVSPLALAQRTKRTEIASMLGGGIVATAEVPTEPSAQPAAGHAPVVVEPKRASGRN